MYVYFQNWIKDQMVGMILHKISVFINGLCSSINAWLSYEPRRPLQKAQRLAFSPENPHNYVQWNFTKAGIPGKYIWIEETKQTAAAATIITFSNTILTHVGVFGWWRCNGNNNCRHYAQFHYSTTSSACIYACNSTWYITHHFCSCYKTRTSHFSERID